MDRARVARREDGIAIPDIKTGRAIIQNGEVNVKGKAAQLGTYQLLYEHTAHRRRRRRNERAARRR
jgi:hypothetical protein